MVFANFTRVCFSDEYTRVQDFYKEPKKILQIVEVEMPFDKTKNQRKGFCFITFESEQVVNELLKTSKQTINGKEVSRRTS